MAEKTAGAQRQVVNRAGSSSNILLQEYNSLINLYTHSENTLFSIFNFYVTLLTTITGAIIVIFQVSGRNAASPYGAVLVLLIFVVLIGIITQDALIHKNADLAHFALALNAVKAYLLQKFPGAQAHVFYLWDLHTRVHPLKYKLTLDEKIDQVLWWLLPIGMPQLFVSLMNSFALAAVVLTITALYGNGTTHLLTLVVTMALVVATTYTTHCAYANFKFRHLVQRKSLAMNNQPQAWLKS